jgi:anti-sigma factor RsiW
MMDKQRFAALTQAWGGDIARWPVNEQEAASAFLEANPHAAHQLLKEAAALDALLETAAFEPPDNGLYERVAQSGFAAAAAPRWAAAAAVGFLVAGLAAGWAGGGFAGSAGDEVFEAAFATLEVSEDDWVMEDAR